MRWLRILLRRPRVIGWVRVGGQGVNDGGLVKRFVEGEEHEMHEAVVRACGPTLQDIRDEKP